MSPKLPPPLANYVEANARLDLDGMIGAFAADAVFLDNGKRFEGRTQIRALLKEMVVDLRAVFTPDSLGHDGDTVVMAGPAQGDFPGTPIRFTYRVKLDGNAIKAMEVSA